MRKHPAVGMRARDLGELYTYLNLFGRVYTDCEAERQIIEHGIEEIFSREYSSEDASTALQAMKNPRKAGSPAKKCQGVKKAAKVGLDVSLKTSIIPEDAIVDLRNLVRDYYYFKDLQSSIVLKLNAELKVSFPAYLGVFSKITTQTSLKLLEDYPLASDMLNAPKEELVKIIRTTARFGEKYAMAKYNALCSAARDAAVFGRALPSNAVRIRLYIDSYREYQKHLDTILEALHESVGKLLGTAVYNRIRLLQSLRGLGFLSAVVLIAEMGSFDLFPSPKKLYAYFGLDPAVKQSGKFKGDKVHMSKRGSSLARRILHMIALNNLKVDKATKEPVNPVIHSYYADKCKSKKKNVAVGAVMHKMCNIKSNLSLCSFLTFMFVVFLVMIGLMTEQSNPLSRKKHRSGMWYIPVDPRKQRLSREYVSCASFIFAAAKFLESGSECRILKGFPAREPFGSMIDIQEKSSPTSSPTDR